MPRTQIRPRANGNGHALLAGNEIVDLTPQRQALKAALTRLHEEAGRLATLQAAAEEVQENSWQAAEPVSLAREELAEAKIQESAYKANFFITNHKITKEPSPRLKAAVAALAAAEAQNAEIWAVRETIEAEVKACEAEIERIRKVINEKIGDLIVASPAWQALHRAQHEGWCQVRAARKTLAMLSKYATQHRDSLKWQVSEHLDWEINGVENSD